MISDDIRFSNSIDPDEALLYTFSAMVDTKGNGYTADKGQTKKI